MISDLEPIVLRKGKMAHINDLTDGEIAEEIKRFYGQSVGAVAVKKERQKMARSQPEAVPGRGKALQIIS